MEHINERRRQVNNKQILSITNLARFTRNAHFLIRLMLLQLASQNCFVTDGTLDIGVLLLALVKQMGAEKNYLKIFFTF